MASKRWCFVYIMRVDNGYVSEWLNKPLAYHPTMRGVKEGSCEALRAKDIHGMVEFIPIDAFDVKIYDRWELV